MTLTDAKVHFRIWGWSSIGLASDDAWRCERPRDSHHPCGHRLWDGTLDDLGYELWHSDNLVAVPALGPLRNLRRSLRDGASALLPVAEYHARCRAPREE